MFLQGNLQPSMLTQNGKLPLEQGSLTNMHSNPKSSACKGSVHFNNSARRNFVIWVSQRGIKLSEQTTNMELNWVFIPSLETRTQEICNLTKGCKSPKDFNMSENRVRLMAGPSESPNCYLSSAPDLLQEPGTSLTAGCYLSSFHLVMLLHKVLFLQFLRRDPLQSFRIISNVLIVLCLEELQSLRKSQVLTVGTSPFQSATKQNWALKIFCSSWFNNWVCLMRKANFSWNKNMEIILS